MKENDILYSCVRPYQNNNVVFKFSGKYVASTGFAQIRYKYPYYLIGYFSSPRFSRDVIVRSTGSSYPAINGDDLSKIKIYIPLDEEQDKISIFLQLVDKKIDLIESKLVTLKKYKRGYAISNIKSLYINDKIPLSKLCEITTGKLDANAMIDNGKYKFFTCAKEDYLIDYYAFDCEALLISGNGEVGLTKYYYGKFNAYQRTYVLHDFKMNPKFIKMCIDSQIKSIIKKETNKGAMPYIKLSTFDKIFIPIIDTKNEEILVKNITILDKKIELLECTLKTLNLLKKQLLNSMFI
ncbi:MAG: restriction endonuclease subunit S [Acholeplasmatales bacterium]|nr:restriction endonuclease subunit S [Acholeplasmatales bacterium]